MSDFDSTDSRWAKDWGTPEEVFAAWSAGWDIDTGPPPDRHALPPEDAEVDATDARAVFHNDLPVGHTPEELTAAKAAADAEHQAALEAGGQA